MSIKSAVELIHSVELSEELREELNNCGNKQEFRNCMERNGFNFSTDEFEDAVRMLHLRCQEQEQAELILEKAMWLRFLIQINEY